MTVPSGPGIAVIVVTYNSADSIAELLRATRAQMQPSDELLVIDNASGDDTVAEIRAADAGATLIESGGNVGFAPAVNLGVERSTAPLVLLLNPDAIPVEGCLAALRATADEQPTWGAWQALVALPDGAGINSAGGRVHYLGFGWAGDWGAPLAQAPAGPTTVGFASGAAMCVRRPAWEQTAGFEESFFMYGEDLELSIRLWLAGWDVGVVPAAVVEHDYEFDKGTNKWFYLERNRWAVVVVCYPTAVLLPLIPALLAFELALLLVAARGGWLRAKLRAQRSALARLPATLRRRRAVQATRRRSARDFARVLTSDLDGAYLAPVAENAVLDVPQRAYWATVKALLPAGGKRRADQT